MLLLHRTALRRRLLPPCSSYLPVSAKARLHASPLSRKEREPSSTSTPSDPRLSNIPSEELIEDKFAVLKSSYQAPKNPIILAHGLLGFDELHLAGNKFPGIEYWYGITQALASKGIEVFTAAVPPSGSIERRAEKLAEGIEGKFGKGVRGVNVIA